MDAKELGEKILELQDLCRKTQMRTMNIKYAESSDTWYVVFNSIVSSENWVGKDHPLEYALDLAIDYLKTLL